MERLEELRSINRALGRIARLTTGRAATRARAERSGVELSRPALAIVAALQRSGPVRLTSLARLVDLEPPLISREVRELADDGIVSRTPDPDDGRASIIALTEVGAALWQRHRDTVDRMTVEAFADWSDDDVQRFREYLDRALGIVDSHNVAVHDGQRS